MESTLWRDALLIARHDLRRMLLARETLLWTFAMPVIFFYFLGTVTGGFATTDPDRPDPIALRGADGGGFLVGELTRRLQEQNFAVATASEAEADGYARRLTLPEPAAGHDDLTASVLDGNQATLTFDRRGDDLNRQYDQLRVGRAVYTVLADLAAASVLDGGASPETFAALEAAPRTVTLEVSSAGRREDPPTGYAQAIPGTMVMFTMLVLMTTGGITLVIERKQGLLRRLASTPVRPASVVAGKWAARMALGVVQIGFAMLLGRVLFGMDWGAAVGMVGLVLLAWAGLNASLALLLGNLARSEGQMAGIGVLGTMALAALGGCWWPIEITPAWMQSLAGFLPTGWTMDALHKLVSFGYGPAAALPHAAALAAGALLCAAAAARTFRYQ